jgi:outer membrane biosynthesis protein TonB
VADNRAFHSAILASLALHALALFAFPDFIDTARRAVSLPPQIIARLMEPEPVAPPVETPPPAPPVKKKESAPPKLVKPVPESATRPAPISDAEPEPPVTEPQPVSPPPVASVAPVPAPVPAAPRTEVSESLSRDQYRIELMAEAARHARTRYPPRGYPPLARENNWEGDVRVGVAVRATKSWISRRSIHFGRRRAASHFRRPCGERISPSTCAPLTAWKTDFPA